MAHNIQKRDIQTGVEMAWHKLTNVVPEITRENSGICYEMERKALTYRHKGEHKKSGFDSIVSLDDGLTIGRPVADSYTMITNGEIFDATLGALSGTKHKLVSCGNVNNREKGFMSIKLDDEFMAGGNSNQSLLNIIWGHAGTLAVIARTGITTIVCQNTMNMALSQKGEFSLSVRHSKHAKFGIENMAQAIDAHFGVKAEFEKAMAQFSEVPANVDFARNVYAGFMSKGEKELSTRSANATNRMVELFQTGKGNRGETQADILGGLTDFYSHESSGGENTWKQFVSSEFGSGNTRKSEFFGLLLDREATEATAKRGEVLLKEFATENGGN